MALSIAAMLLPFCATAQQEASQHDLAVCADPSNLPFSNERLEGFENKLASLIAEDLHATLRYTWNVQRRSFLRRTLQSGSCDLVMNVPAGLRGVLETRPYYASSYVFVSARDRELPWRGFDDPGLQRLKLGLQAIGAEGSNTPPASALAHRGLAGNVVGFPMWGAEDVESPPARIIDAVAAGEIDAAVVWGPIAGYFAQRYPGQMRIEPVTSDPQLPSLAFTFQMALGVRKGEEAFRDTLQDVLDRRKSDILALLKDYGVPLMATASAHELPAPADRVDRSIHQENP